MVQQFKLCPIINGTSDFKSILNFITNFTLVNSIEDGLPFGYFEILDNDSAILGKFDNLQIGSKIEFEPIYDDSSIPDEIKKLKIKDFVILNIIAKKSEKSNKSNILKVFFGHKMFLYKDMTNHCYEAQNNDALIKKILEDKTRGCSFKLKESDSPDNDPIKRYKVQESDWEFLQNKVVKYSAFKKTAMYLYSDLNNDFYFKSVSSMFNKNPNILLCTELGSEEDSKAYKEFSQKYSTKEEELLLDFELDIGNKKSISEMNQQFSIFDSQTNITYSGIKMPSAKIENDSSNLAKYYPIDYYYEMTTKSGSSIVSINNHRVNDAYNLLNNSLKDFDSIFTFNIKTRFSAQMLNIGSCIVLFIAKNHWANGKWLLKKSTFSIDNEGNSIIYAEVCRPTFSGEKNNTTLENYGSLYMRQE